MEFDDQLAQARERLNDGEPHDAVRALRSAALTPDLEHDEARLVALVDVLARGALALGMSDLAERVRVALDGPQVLYEAGYALIEAGLPDIAVPLLRRLDAQLPGHAAVVSELVAALERNEQSSDACHVLLEHEELLDEFLFRYLLVFNAIMAGNLALARAHALRLNAEGEQDVDGESAEQLKARVEAMLGRSARVEPTELRGWHYTLNSCVLLHLSPHGFEEPMHGRWGWVQDREEMIRLGLERAHAVLEAWGEAPIQVVACPDHGSQCVAQAAHTLWNVPVVPWSAGAEGLVVAYDLDEVPEDVRVALADRGSQRLFVHACRWTAPPTVAPDLCTMLTQVHVAPWGQRMAMDPETGETRRSEPSADTAVTWGQRIAQADATPERLEQDTTEALVAFARIARPDHVEFRFWSPGPIRSARFR